MTQERKSPQIQLAKLVDPGGFINPNEYQQDALYTGMGGNLGRIAIYRGEYLPDRILFEGYQVYYDNQLRGRADLDAVPVLKTEAYLPTELANTAFRPIRLITEATPSLSGNALLDWLIVKDLEQAELRLKNLHGMSKDLRKTQFMRSEIKDVEELIKLIQRLKV